ncbi:hypothetical protein M514_18105 [Trichuris suis]|uniref:Uncharacterized protein n=1 Tax=Trichuris suis TaxID=68888 RepID=A0A085NJS4_9BILA|nr:hypothetical protein M514_18105 [Trichuris suis]
MTKSEKNVRIFSILVPVTKRMESALLVEMSVNKRFAEVPSSFPMLYVYTCNRGSDCQGAGKQKVMLVPGCLVTAGSA